MTNNPSNTLTLTSSTIISTLEVVAGTHLVWLEAPQVAATARPGQFVMVRGGGDTLLRRPLSIHQVDGDRMALLFQIVGKGTRWLSQRRMGEKLDIFGPLGNGFTIQPSARNILLVAGGMGIAPLRFLAETACRHNIKVNFLTGASSARSLCPVIPLPQPAHLGEALPVINAVTATDDGSDGFKGPVTDLISAYLDEVDQVCACGPVGMYRTMTQMPELKNRSVQLSLEIMMGCGVGVCYGCTIRTKGGLKQVCQDGPVFDLADLEGINWDEVGGA